MLLVYVPKITPRIEYIFDHIFNRILKIEINFTFSIESFVAYSGPKFSYSAKPLGKEFHLTAHPILFSQGIQEYLIKIEKWEELPAFFYTPKNPTIPFDLFAASFYLLSRYEEYFPYIPDDLGRYDSKKSLAYKYNFLEIPVIDFWACKIRDIFLRIFPDLEYKKYTPPPIIPIVEILAPYKFRQKSILKNTIEIAQDIWDLEFIEVINRFQVFFNLQKDPYDNYNELIHLFESNHLKAIFFFLFSKTSYYDQGSSIFNKKYHSLIKTISDYYKTSLLASFQSFFSSSILKKEINLFSNLILRPVESLRKNKGILKLNNMYQKYLAQEIKEDYSMNYPDRIGYRASTSVPFYFYDISNEIRTSLKIYPIIATQEGLEKFSPQKAYTKLETLYKQLPTSTSKFCWVFSPKILDKSYKNKEWRNNFIEFLKNTSIIK